VLIKLGAIILMSDELMAMLDRIIKGQPTDADIETLRQLLVSGDRQFMQQLGKYNVNIGEGKDIYIGDRIYQQWDKDAMEALIKAIKETSGINQNTQSGDAAAGNIDKRNIYENCTIIQLLASDSKFSDRFQEQVRDIDFSRIPKENIQQAYQNSLPPDAEVWDLEGNNVEMILRELNGFRRLFQFFERLSQDKNLPVEIRDQIVTKLASKNHSEKSADKPSADFFCDETVTMKSYLIATLIPNDNDSDHFLLNAWLIVDDSVEGLSKFQSLLDQNEQQVGKLCDLNQVPTELNKFLKKALRSLRGKKYRLVIEFFLPSDLMCMEIDRWKITDPVGDEVALGTRYPIRLRSLERLDLDYLDSYLSQWYEYWDKVRKVLQNKTTKDAFENLAEIENFNWKLLKTNLKEKIGLKVTCAHPQSIRKELFRAILQATTPVAIWTRTDILNLDQVTAMDDILTFKPLCHLCESVRQTREKADAYAEDHLGLHLALLWENPYRLPPDVMLELTTPGQ
jgi:hypothetical protein